MRPLQIVMGCLLLAGCESPKAAVPIQAVSIKADNFCPVMRRLRPPDGIPTWDLTDSQETIDYNRRLEAVVVKKCLASRPRTQKPTPTS
jgi:hypothetical protein